MKNKLVVILFIIVFALLIAVVCSLLNDNQDITDIGAVRLPASDMPAPTVAVPTADPAPAAQPPEPSLLPLPTPEPTPVPTPVPTPEPTPTPAPVGLELGSGSFASASPVPLNIIADWSAKTVDDNTVAVTVTVSAESYSLHLEPTKSLHVSLGGEYVTVDVPALIYDGSTLAKNQLGSTTINLSLPAGSSNSYTLAVEWQFGGFYMNTPIEVLECGGSIDLVR